MTVLFISDIRTRLKKKAITCNCFSHAQMFGMSSTNVTEVYWEATSEKRRRWIRFNGAFTGTNGRKTCVVSAFSVWNITGIIGENFGSRVYCNRLSLLQPVIPGAPFERWYINLTGPHPKSERGHTWILTCMDSFTKRAEAFPLRNKEAEPIAKILVEQVFCRFGIPLSILSDQGKEVDGRIMREVCSLFGIEKLQTTPYKPSTNQVERFHRTLNSILGKTVAEHQKDWDTRLVFALSAYRATRHNATGYSPNFLVLGPRAPPDIVHGPIREGDKYDPFVERLLDRMVKAYAEVCMQLRKSAGYNKMYYDIGVKPCRFEAGQWVWYFNPRKLRGKQMKWMPQYEGPYLILKMLSPLVTKIQQSSRLNRRLSTSTS